MPLDASIYQSIQPVRQPNPLASYAQALQVQGLQSDLAKAARDEQTQTAVADAYRGAVGADGTIDRNKLLASVAGAGGGAQIPAIQKSFLDQDKAKNEALKAQYEQQLQKFDVAARIMSGVTDQPSWDRARQQTAQVFGQETAAQMPAEYNPQLIAENQQKAMAVKDQIEARYKALQFGETQRHDSATEANAAGNLAVNQGQLAVSQGRLALDQTAPKGQVVEGPNGLVVVDPRTAQSKPVTDAAGAAVGSKPSEAQKKELMSIQQQRSIINGAIEAVQNTPDAFSFKRGMAGKVPFGESVAGRMESDAQTQARSYLFNNVSRVINERAGAAQSAQELARLNGFLPADTDNSEQIVNKLKAFNHYLDDLESGTRGTPRTVEGSNARAGGAQPAAAGKQVVRSGTLPNGRRVVQYSDGSSAYAD